MDETLRGVQHPAYAIPVGADFVKWQAIANGVYCMVIVPCGLTLHAKAIHSTQPERGRMIEIVGCELWDDCGHRIAYAYQATTIPFEDVLPNADVPDWREFNMTEFEKDFDE
jgi:hypothetical protein